MDALAPKPMPCPRCGGASIVDPHPESTAVVGLYECPQCRLDWTARFNGDVVTITVSQTGTEPMTMTASLKSLNTAIIERLR